MEGLVLLSEGFGVAVTSLSLFLCERRGCRAGGLSPATVDASVVGSTDGAALKSVYCGIVCNQLMGTSGVSSAAAPGRRGRGHLATGHRTRLSPRSR